MADVPRHVQTEDKAFVRDTHSKALLNTDTTALQRHRAARRKNAEIQELKEQVARLTSLVESLIQQR